MNINIKFLFCGEEYNAISITKQLCDKKKVSPFTAIFTSHRKEFTPPSDTNPTLLKTQMLLPGFV